MPRADIERIRFHQRIGHVASLRGEECIRHPAPNQELVDLAQERVDHIDFARDFRPAQDRDERSRRVFQRGRQIVDFALQQQIRRLRSGAPIRQRWTRARDAPCQRRH